MKNQINFAILACFLSFFSHSRGLGVKVKFYSHPPATSVGINKNIAVSDFSSSFAFTENKGQIYGYDGLRHPEVKFVFDQRNTQIFLLEKGLAYQFTSVHYPEGYQELMREKLGKRNMEKIKQLKKNIRTETFRMDMSLVGANKHSKITMEGKSDDYVNFYNRSVFDVHSFSKVIYHEVYPGIDWVIYTKDNSVKYDFVVRAGADPSVIKMQFENQENLKLNDDGSFTLKNTMGSITEKKPVSFQGEGIVSTRFVLNNKTLSFHVENYNRSKMLVIDPSLSWATYYGGTNDDEGSSCITDAMGNVYLTGSSGSTVGIASGGHQNTFGGGSFDAFLVKFNSAGVRQWATYYGGDEDFDLGVSCAVNATSGDIYLAGNTTSSANIASGGFQNTIGGGVAGANNDAFLVKFNSSGVRQWATYYGDVEYEEAYSCACDASGNVYLAGATESTVGIASGGYLNAFGGNEDGFLVKFNSAGVRQWGTYYGDVGTEEAYSCACDASGDVYLGGLTNSTSGIASGGHQNTWSGGYDAFLVKFNSAGVRQWATYYGGSKFDNGFSCCVDASGNVYLAGETSSGAGIASGGHQNTSGGNRDSFLAKFNSAGVRQWGTYYGGVQTDNVAACATDVIGNVYLAGYTTSGNNIASAGYQNALGGGSGEDAFLVKFNSAGVRQWGSYYGGSGDEEAYSSAAIAIDASGSIYLSGLTTSTASIASGGYQNTFGGGYFEAFLVKFCEVPAQPSVITGNTIVCQGSGGTFSVANDVFATSYNWSTPAGWTGNSVTNTVNLVPLAGGVLSVSAVNACGTSPTRTLGIDLTPLPTLTISGASSICPGASVTLVANGASSYSWSTGATTDSIVATPTTNTTYSVTGTNTLGCSATSTMLVSLQSISIIGPSVICVGETASLTATGAISYSWSTGATSSSIITTPTINTTYTVTGTDALGCSISTTQLVNVAASLSISISGPSVICEGQTANLTANGVVTYVWDTGATSASIAVNPVITTTYTVVGASGTCSNSATKVLTVNPNPTVAITGNTVVCVGLSTTLSASGASTYSWNTNATTNTIVSTPTTATGYSVIGTSSLGCQGTATVAVATNTLPVINIAQSSSVICVGTSVTFTALGADTYSWSSGPNTSTLLLTPAVSDNYTISGTNLAGCISSATTNIVVNALPNITITASSPTVCLQSLVNFTASGATTFTWNGNTPINTAAVSFTPLSAMVYTVIGTDGNGCVNSQTVSVITNSLPIVSIAPASATVCSQSAVNFTASGGNTYFWNNVNVTTANITFFPPTNATYTVIGTSAQGCSSSATVAVTALSLPAVAVNPSFTTVCEFSNHTYTANGAVTYTWNSNNAITGSLVSISTPSSTSYNVVGTGTNGCTNNAQFVVIANALPTISVVVSTPTVCSLQSVQLDALGANSYTWSNGALTTSAVVTPSTTSIYTVTGQNTVTGCSSTQTTALTVNPLPVLTVLPASPTVCVNTPITLSAVGASTYVWSNNSVLPNTTVTPSVNTSYSVTGTDGLGCTNSTVVSVAVVPYPVISITPPSATVCTGETATFVASGADTYTWAAGGSVFLPTLTITPAASGVYNVTGANLNNCKTSATATVVVDVCTGIENKTFTSQVVKLYPNPTTGAFTVEFGFEGEKTILIVNSIGQLILETVTSEISQNFDLNGFAKGIYFVKVNSKQASGNYKLITD